MREVPVPPDLPPLTGSAVASLAAILELDAAAVPARPPKPSRPVDGLAQLARGPRDGHGADRRPGGVQLAGAVAGGPARRRPRGVRGRVRLRRPGSPGTRSADRRRSPTRARATRRPADVALWSPASAGRPDGGPRRGDRRRGGGGGADRARRRRPPPTPAAGSGDRYHEGRGTFSAAVRQRPRAHARRGRGLEALGFTPGDARRNVVTRGIDLNALVGRRFQVGDVECVGRRLCEPCAHLERLSPGILRPLVHRGGLRADLLGDGAIRVGDAVSRSPRNASTSCSRSRASGSRAGPAPGTGTASPGADRRRSAGRRACAGAAPSSRARRS